MVISSKSQINKISNKLNLYFFKNGINLNPIKYIILYMLPRRRKKSNIIKTAEIKKIELQHREILTFVQILFAFVITVIVSFSVLYWDKPEFNTVVLISIIILLVFIIGIMFLYYTKFKNMKDEVVKIATKGQAEILWIILAIIVILFLLYYFGLLPPQ